MKQMGKKTVEKETVGFRKDTVQKHKQKTEQININRTDHQIDGGLYINRTDH